MAASAPNVRLRTGPDSSAKRAALLADRIIDDVVAQGWPVGKVLGSETELLARYRVSRAVFREAVRLLEHQHVARTRRGPGGGLVVSEPSVGTVARAVMLYLARVDAQIDDVFEARLALEEIAADLAPERLNPQERDNLRAYVDGLPGVDDDPRALHRAVAAATRNPAIELFVGVLARIAMLFAGDVNELDRKMVAASSDAHTRIAAAVIAGDRGRARHYMNEHLTAELEYLRHAGNAYLRDVLVRAEMADGKRGEVLAGRLTRQVLAERMPPGTLIGTETSLMQREGVSRAVLREAVRLLEFHNVAQMRRGPGGGLFVAVPSERAVTDIVAVYLTRHAMQVADLAELRTEVEVALAALAAERIDRTGVARMHDALEREVASRAGETADVLRDLHAAVAEGARNRTLSLLALVLIRLTQMHSADRDAERTRDAIRDDVLHAHRGIAEAIEARDTDLARRRMKRHLDEVGASLQPD